MRSSRVLLPIASLSSVLLLAACAGGIVSVPPDSQSHTVSIAVDQELRITLGNVGPAMYESPPQISSDALRFLDVEVIPPFTPGGPTQQFRFKGVHSGQAIIHFRRLLGDSLVASVEDTVRIR